MEKESVIIEIKQEVSITLLWIVGGVMLVTATFLLAPRSTELWPALNAAGIAAGLYLVALLAYVLRGALPLRMKMLIGTVSVVVIGCTAFAWTRMEDHSGWQASELIKIRAVIGRGIRISEMPKPLLKTLDAYHSQGAKSHRTLADEFRTLYPGAGVGSDIYKRQGDWDTMNMVVDELTPDRIALVSQEVFVKGRDSTFKNRDGKLGMLQEKFILTERGLTHVSEN